MNDFRNSWIPEFLVSWIPEFLDYWITGLLAGVLGLRHVSHTADRGYFFPTLRESGAGNNEPIVRLLENNKTSGELNAEHRGSLRSALDGVTLASEPEEIFFQEASTTLPSYQGASTIEGNGRESLARKEIDQKGATCAG